MQEEAKSMLGRFDRTSTDAIRPDAQAFDEVRIVTVPRYKQSGLSGDEWRISAEIQYFRKGEHIFSTHYRNVEIACGFAFADYVRGIDEGKAYFAGTGKLCDQEGCAKPATVHYKLKKLFSREGYESVPTQTTMRHFCDEHKTRGDCGLEDADRNYELVK